MDTVLPACRDEFLKYKRMAESAIAQLSWEQLAIQISPQQNSIAVIVKHLAGNMRSRWTDFLASDGEKPGRNREAEFVADYVDRDAMMGDWESGWKCMFDALSPLTDSDLSRTVYIRKEPHSVFKAINRQTSHYAYHIGQILLIAKHVAGERWQYLTIPPGGSARFNESKGISR